MYKFAICVLSVVIVNFCQMTAHLRSVKLEPLFVLHTW